MNRAWSKSPPPQRRSFNTLQAVAVKIEAGGDPAELAAEIRAIATTIREGNRRRRVEQKRRHDERA